MLCLTVEGRHTSFASRQIGRVKCFEPFQIVRGQQGKDDMSKQEVVPFVQPLVPHVDCSEVLYVVSSHWLYVAHGACHNSVQIVIGQEMPEEL